MLKRNDFATNLELLSGSAWASAALLVSLELGLLGRLSTPMAEREVAEYCGIDDELAGDLVEVLVSLGAVERRVEELVPTSSFELFSSTSLRRVLKGELRGDHLQIRDLLERVREGQPLSGWTVEDPVALTAQGDTGGMIGLIVEALVPGLRGLGERMEDPGARILDVGAGVGVISTELCRIWPAAEAVGLEPHRTARELGRSRIAAAGLSDRIALRDERIELLGEHSAYDLAFVPQPFIDSDALDGGLPRIRRALKPGGWLIVLANDPPGGAGALGAARRFRARIWGGGTIDASSLGSRLERIGFEGVRTDYPIGSFRAICAARPLVDAAMPELDDLLEAGSG